MKRKKAILLLLILLVVSLFVLFLFWKGRNTVRILSNQEMEELAFYEFRIDLSHYSGEKQGIYYPDRYGGHTLIQFVISEDEYETLQKRIESVGAFQKRPSSDHMNFAVYGVPEDAVVEKAFFTLVHVGKKTLFGNESTWATYQILFAREAHYVRAYLIQSHSSWNKVRNDSGPV